MADSINDLGPLPEGDRQETLERLSFDALNARLPKDRFLFRPEPIHDKGVDGTLEVVLPNPQAASVTSFSNFRAHIQMKSTDKVAQNKDGSVSFQIETTNLNYLLNGQSPMYFLWISATNEIRYAWARDEWQRLDAENPDWRSQGKHTVRFSTVLTSQQIPLIADRIRDEGRLSRKIAEALARSALAERVVVSIDPKTLESTDPREFYERLVADGMAIVSAGYARVVLDWLEVINPDAKREPRIQLVAAYANANLGLYLKAIGHIADAAVRLTELSPFQQQFLGFMRTACEFHTGRIALAEFLKRSEEWGSRQAAGGAASHKFEVLRQTRLQETDREKRAKLYSDMIAQAEIVQSSSDATSVQKLEMRILLVCTEGEELGTQFINSLALIGTRKAMGYSTDSQALAAAVDTSRLWTQWKEKTDAILRDAVAIGHPLFMADALTCDVVVLSGVLHMQRMYALGENRSWAPSQDTLIGLMREAEKAIELYKQAGSLEGECRAKLQLAALFDLSGAKDAAKKLAEGVLPIAEAMDYTRHIGHAREYVTGQTQFERFLAEAVARREDDDPHLARETDEGLRGMARHVMESLKLPAERFPVVERECFCMRRVANERVHWCRHLEMIQNLSHTRSLSTMYMTDPPRLCRCDKHKFQSSLEFPDPETVISAFKATYCSDCSDRNPKQAAPATTANA